IDRGRTVIEDTPAGLKRAIGGDRIEVVVTDPADLPAAAKLLAEVSNGAEPQVDSDELRVHAPATDRVHAVAEVARRVQEAGIDVQDLGLRRPTLDEVFLQLTGHQADPNTSPSATATQEGART